MNDYTVEVSITFEVKVSANSSEEAEGFIGSHSLEELITHQTGSHDLELQITSENLEAPTWIS